MDSKYDKKRAAGMLLCLFAIVAAGYLAFLFWVNQRVVTVDVAGCEKAGAQQMEYKIDKIKCMDDYVEISGYAYEPGVSIDRADTSLLAYDPVTEVYYKLPTENIKREKITEKADDGFNYDYAQFSSVTLRDKIPGGCRLCILYRGNGENRLIQTDEVIFY